MRRIIVCFLLIPFVQIQLYSQVPDDKDLREYRFFEITDNYMKLARNISKTVYLKVAVSNPAGLYGNIPSADSPLLEPFLGREGIGATRGYNAAIGIQSLNTDYRLHFCLDLSLDISGNSFDWSELGGSWAANAGWSQLISADLKLGIGLYYNIWDEIILEGMIYAGYPVVTKYPELIFDSPDQNYTFIIFPRNELVWIGDSESAFVSPVTWNAGIRRGRWKLAFETYQRAIKQYYYFKYESVTRTLEGEEYQEFSSNFKMKSNRLAVYFYF